jgi:ABC-type transport system involved in Fe-S cluster assembly fused permease/ATPase subunit
MNVFECRGRELHVRILAHRDPAALSKGSSINTFLEQVTFQVVPMLVDLVIAIVFFLALTICLLISALHWAMRIVT